MADACLNTRTQPDDGYRIRVSSHHIDALKAAFKAEKGRQPSAAELHVRLQQWLDEQMLYEHAKRLGLDQRDAIVRRQMVQKMRFLLADATPIPEPSEAQLQAWLDEHPQRYGHSPALSFDQVFLSRGARGDRMGESVRALLDHLEASPDDFLQQGDPFPAGQVITDFDEAAMRREFGREFYARIQALPEHSWQGPVASSLGLHMLRITRRSDFRAAQLSEVRDRVSNDWRVSQREKANAEAMQRLRQRFEVEYEGIQQMGAG